MIGAIAIALGFLMTAAVETSVLHAFPLPYAAFPLMLICGTLVMHRLDRTIGAAWIITAGAVAHPWGFDLTAFLPYTAAACAGYLLTANVFTNRSVYALFGLGICMKVLITIGRVLEQWLLALVNHPTMEPIGFGTHVVETIFLIVGLYVGAALMRRVQAWGERTFFVHS